MRGVIRALARRFALPPRREAAPLALLLLALSSVFVFGGDRGYLYRPGHHDVNTAQTMVVAANLSPDDGFQMCRRRQPESELGPSCAYPYNVFPIGSYALVRLATEAAGDSLARQLYAARLLMLAFFAGAAVLAHLAITRLTGDRRIALAATLLAFSSYYILYYADMVSVEASTNLFGIMLVFHGMVLHAQEGRFRQLLAKTAVALLLGWHAAALVAAFVLLGLASEAWRTRRRADGDLRPYVRRALAALARSPYLAYGVLAALCLGLLLGWAVANEYLAVGGERTLTGLRVFDSLARRSGFAAQGQDFGAHGWPEFLLQQLAAAGGSAIPFALVDRLGLDLAQPDYAYWPPNPWFAAPGAAVLAACAAGLRTLHHRTPWAALLLAGWSWAIPFRGSAVVHEYEAMFHVGAALVFFALALLGLRRLLGRERAARALPAAALAAAAVFALSARDMSGIAVAGADVQRQRGIVADMKAIRELAEGRSILISPAYDAMGQIGRNRNLYLHGIYTRVDPIGSRAEWARASASGAFDFVLTPVGIGGSLTPGNRHLHLYRPSALDAAWESAAARKPALGGPFSLHLDGRTLTWIRDGCAQEDMRHIFVEAWPLAAPPQRFEFWFRKHGLRLGGRCLARFELPDYPLAGVRTGQLAVGDLPPVWEASLPVAGPLFPRGATTWYEDVTSAEPAARGPFAVYRDGRTLTYARGDCAATDTEARFFVHAYAADPGDLPEDRREAGFEATGFAFADRGVRFGGTCMAQIALPGYPLRGIRTGQLAGGDLPPVWEASLPAGDPSFPRGATTWYEDVTSAAPAARGPFAVYRDGRALTFARGDCAATDTEARFFVHAYAPGGRREVLDFWFADRGVRFGGTCMARIALPDYEVRSVRTGQYDASGHLWDEEFALDAASWLARFDALSAREPDAWRAGFALRLEGRTLTLARESCGAPDVADRFFVHAYAPDGARENLDFWFRERGLRHGDRCLASVGLPPYPLARLVAGQYDASGHLWEAVLVTGE